MKPSLALAAHRSEIREIVLAHKTENARVFGSVAKGLDSEHSDLDILVDPTSNTSLFDLGAIRFILIAIPANFQLRKHMLQQTRSVKVLGGGNVFKVHAWGVFFNWGQININFMQVDE